MNLTAFFIYLLNQVTLIIGGNIGASIILVTLLIRAALIPLVLPSIKSQRKIKELQPEIDKLKKKHGKDKEVFAKKQMELYKLHKVNPLGGCLPQLVQLGLFIVFYQVLISSLNGNGALHGSFDFFWLNLREPDKLFVLPVLAAVTQFLLALMLMPAVDNTTKEKLASQTVSAKDDKDAIDTDAMAKTMQSQMVYVMPFVTGFIALRFPSGLALYWVTSTLFSILQQYMVSGPGGIEPFFRRFKINSK